MLKTRAPPGEKKLELSADLAILLGKHSKGTDHALTRKTEKFQKRDLEYRGTNREENGLNNEGQDYWVV